jgi:chromosome segregation ATPase
MADYRHILDSGRSYLSDGLSSSPDVASARSSRAESRDEATALRTHLRQVQDRCSELEKALEDGRRRESMLSKLQENTINLMQTMQRSHDEATAVLTSRIKSLEDILEPCKREAADAMEVKERLLAKESECDELVHPDPRLSDYSLALLHVLNCVRFLDH